MIQGTDAHLSSVRECQYCQLNSQQIYTNLVDILHQFTVNLQQLLLTQETFCHNNHYVDTDPGKSNLPLLYRHTEINKPSADSHSTYHPNCEVTSCHNSATNYCDINSAAANETVFEEQDDLVGRDSSFHAIKVEDEFECDDDANHSDATAVVGMAMPAYQTCRVNDDDSLIVTEESTDEVVGHLENVSSQDFYSSADLNADDSNEIGEDEENGLSFSGEDLSLLESTEEADASYENELYAARGEQQACSSYSSYGGQSTDAVDYGSTKRRYSSSMHFNSQLFNDHHRSAAAGQVVAAAIYSCKYCGKGLQTNFQLQQHHLHVHGIIERNHQKLKFRNSIRKYNSLRGRSSIGSGYSNNSVRSSTTAARSSTTSDSVAPPSGIGGDEQDHQSAQSRFVCAACNQSFRTDFELNMHTRSNHHAVLLKPHRCGLCPKSFYQKSDLNVHMQNNHTDRQFKCELCYKTFARKPDFRDHLNTHTGEKPYSCNNLCGKRFALRKTEWMHRKRCELINKHHVTA